MTSDVESGSGVGAMGGTTSGSEPGPGSGSGSVPGTGAGGVLLAAIIMTEILSLQVKSAERSRPPTDSLSMSDEFGVWEFVPKIKSRDRACVLSDAKRTPVILSAVRRSRTESKDPVYADMPTNI